MRKLFSAVLSLFLLVPASITWAQTIEHQKGLLTFTFNTGSGVIKVYLPDDILDNRVISGTVSLFPGGNEKQKSRNLETLKSNSLRIGSEQVPLSKPGNDFIFQLNTISPGLRNIDLLGPSGNVLSNSVLPDPPTSNKLPPGSCTIPSHAITGAPMRITGPFDGNSQNTSCNIRSVGELPILAESVSQCIIYYPVIASPATEVNVQENQKPVCTSIVHSVELNVKAGKLNLVRGERTTIQITVTGLQRLADTAFLQIANSSESTINLEPANKLSLPVLPDSISGIYSTTLNVQSIRTGNFSVNVNLDLPEQPGSAPLPNNNTESQCPVCQCSCAAVILIDKTEGDIVTYSVKTTASCSGQYGPAPCRNCGIVDAFTYDWLLSFSAGDPVEWVGEHTGPIVRIRNKSNAPFTLTANVKVTCIDGTSCTCTAEYKNHVPEIPVTSECGICQCECGAKIICTDNDGDEWNYFADVVAACSGKFGVPPCKDCAVTKIEYSWKINNTDIAKISGSSTGSSVKVRIIKPGKFTLSLTVTVTCSDGKTCTCTDSREEEVPEKGCLLTWEEMNYPVMKGGLDPGMSKAFTLRRDDFLPLIASAEDEDMIKFTCTKLAECLDNGSIKFEKLAGNFAFDWEIKGPGSFVGIGCLDESKIAKGEQIIFKPPYVPLPGGKATESVIKTTILLIISDKSTGAFKDPDITCTISVSIKRTTGDPDRYKIELSEKKTSDAVVAPKINTVIKDCKPTGKWTDVSQFKAPEILLPPVENADKLLVGEMILIKVKPQVDEDNYNEVCESKNQCTIWRNYNRVFKEKLNYTWKTDAGKFAGSNSGSDKGESVIFIAPVVSQATSIHINLKVDDGNKYFDDEARESSVTITVYPGGIKLDYPDENWVPDPLKPAEIKSYLVYLEEDKWKEAFMHSCRIQFFELMDVSAQPGTCLNFPSRTEAKICRDIKIKEEDGHEAFMDTSSILNCHGKSYFMQARTKEPVNSYILKLHTEDYGAFGFLRSFANINKGGAEAVSGQAPLFISVPIKREEVTHPMDGQNGVRREKRTEYTDNRVNIPKDIDENHIPDNGWITGIVGNTIYRVSDFTTDIASDGESVPSGDNWPGDGISVYEEYRGFMVSKPKVEHRRLDPSKKDLFINNRNDLDLKEFIRITGIPVHQINESQYSSLDEDYFRKHDRIYITNHRFVNFNNQLAHVTDQKGLLVMDEKLPNNKDGSYLLGLTPSVNKEADDTPRPGPPNWNDFVKIDIAKIKLICKKNKEDELKEETKIPQVVAHELCHALNVYHHGEDKDDPGLASGDIDCIMRYDNWGVNNEKPGTTLCTGVNGANTKKDRGNCAGQIRVSGRIQPGVTGGYPKKKL